MDIFIALADPTRRSILEILALSGKLSASEISNKFQITAAAISQHLKVLREVKLVRVEKKAQQRLYEINPDTLQELTLWTEQLKAKMDSKFDRLEELLEKEKNRLEN